MNRRLWVCLTEFCLGLVLAACRTDNLEPNAQRGPNPPVSVQALAASSDTLIASADAALRSGDKNSNTGNASTLPVKMHVQGDTTIAIVRFDQASIVAAVGSGILSTATLEFAVQESETAPGGTDIDLHRVLKQWTEAGVTWKCAEDLKPSNSATDCPTTAWKMGGANPDAFASARTARSHLNPGQTGVARFDVTSDVQAFLAGTSNHGWILKAGSASSRTLFWSREAALKPHLVLSLAPATPVTLGVVIERGVITATPLHDTTYSRGARVSYSLEAGPGHRNLRATLDGTLVPASGAIAMSDDHVLIASADSEVVVGADDQGLLSSGRALLTAADPISAYQDYLDHVSEVLGTTSTPEAEARLDAVEFEAFDPIADSASLRRLDAALANHVFRVSGPSGLSATGSRPRSTRTLAAVTPTAEETTFLYVNGISTDPLYAARTAQQVRALVSEVSQFQDPAFQVSHYYNRTFSAESESFSDHVFRCVEMLERRSTFLGSRSRLLFMIQCIGDRTRNILTDQDMLEAIGQYLDVMRNRPVADIDARVLADTLQLLRARGRHVITVPHSQGNLMVQQAVNDFRSIYGFSEERDSICVAAVSLAAPTDRNWPLPVDRVKGIVLRGDIVADVAGNAWPRLDNEVTDSAQAEIAELERLLVEAPNLGDYVAYREAEIGIEIHQVVGSYLLPFASRRAIQDSLVMAHSSCAIGRVAISPSNATIPPGDSLQLADTVYNQLDKQIFGHKSDWSSSNPAVASVDSTGLVHGHVDGTTLISARAGPRTGNVLINVGGPSPFPGKYVYGGWSGVIAAPGPDGGTCPATMSIGLDATMHLNCPGNPQTYFWPIQTFPPNHVRVILRQTEYQRMDLSLTGGGDTLEGTWWFIGSFYPDGVAVSFTRNR